jgi:hypothetical protein
MARTPARRQVDPTAGARFSIVGIPALLVLLCAVAVGCGSSGSVVPQKGDVRAELGRHGINLSASPTDAHGCTVMRPRATNSGARRTYGDFSVVIATRDSCNNQQTPGSADGNHIYWSHKGARWMAHEQLLDNLWLLMVTRQHKLGDQQHALEKAAFNAFDAGD